MTALSTTITVEAPAAHGPVRLVRSGRAGTADAVITLSRRAEDALFEILSERRSRRSGSHPPSTR